MHERELVERSDGLFLPIVTAEDDVAIEPGDLVASARNPLDRNIQQSLLLPHDVVTADLHEYVGILSSQLEFAVEGELHRDEGNGEMLAERAVIFEPASVADRVE